MKKNTLFSIFLILIFALSACTGVSGDQSSNGSEENEPIPQNEGSVFIEDEVQEPEDADSFVIPEDEVHPGSEEGDPEIVIEEDELPPLTVDNAKVFPPAGKSNWEITHEDGVINCGNLSQTFGNGEIEVVEFEAGPPPTMDALNVNNLGGNPEISLWLDYENPIAEYTGVYEIPGTGDSLDFNFFFGNSEGGQTANIVYGTISSTAGGCFTSRDFNGVLVP